MTADAEKKAGPEPTPEVRRLIEVATNLSNYAWSAVSVNGPLEAADYLNKMLADLRTALRDVPPPEMPTLDEAERNFRAVPSHKNAATLLKVAGTYAQDGELTYDGFASITEEVAGWLDAQKI